MDRRYKNIFENNLGNCLYASGSPFNDVVYKGKTLYPAQASHPKKITDDMLYTATKALAEFTDDRKIEKGYIYPKITDIRTVSQEVAIKVIQCAHREGLCQQVQPIPLLDVDELRKWNDKKMYKATYQQIVTKEL